MTYYWIVICGIIFTSVDADSDIAPQQEAPLKKLLKRTLNHMKSFLGEFEKKIKRSRLLVHEIHSRSLFNISKTKRNDLRTISTKSSHPTSFIRYPESPFIIRALETRPQNATGVNNKTLSGSLNTSYVHNVVRQVDNPIIYPKLLVPGDLSRVKKEPDQNILFGKIETSLTRNEKPFTHAVSLHEDEVNTNPEKRHTDTHLGIDANILLGKVKTIATTKRQGLLRLQPENILRKRHQDLLTDDTVKIKIPQYPKTQKDSGSKLNRTKPIVMLKSFTFDKRSVAATKYPNPLMRQRQIVHKTNGNAQITKGWKELIKHLEIFEDPTYTTKTKTSTITQKGKPVARINQQEKKRVNLQIFASKQALIKDDLPIGTVPQETMKRTLLKSDFKEERLPTLSKFYFQQKLNLITALQLDYPDIFSRSTSNKPAVIITRPVSTKKQLILFTTRSPEVFSSRIVPEPAKDYPNVYFRATSLNEHIEPKKHQLKDKTNGSKSKRTIATPVSTTVHKMKNENLRKIIAESSYSLSDEEAYLKVNLLDQLLHYNKTLEI